MNALKAAQELNRYFKKKHIKNICTLFLPRSGRKRKVVVIKQGIKKQREAEKGRECFPFYPAFFLSFFKQYPRRQL